MSSAAPCQEPPPPPFPGAPAAACGPLTTPAEVAPETTWWLDSLWATAAAAAAADLPAEQEQEEPPPPPPLEGAGQLCHWDHLSCLLEARGSGDQLSTQLYKNKQLQDTLLQKEEELARLHEENNHLRQFLNSALVKRLEEKTKELLWQNGPHAWKEFRSGKRRLKSERSTPVPREASHPQKARRNLFGDFSACEEQPDPAVASWVLRTLGLKDVDTIDETSLANCSAAAWGVAPGSFLQPVLEDRHLATSNGQPTVYRHEVSPPRDSTASANPRRDPLPPVPQLTPLHCHPSLLGGSGPSRPGGSPSCSGDLSPTKMDVAFTASLSPHCNVRTHTFRQGQAFVRRDEDGGWKLTWVPKQPE